MKSYIDNHGRKLFVAAGLGGNVFGTFWQSKSGGKHRVKSPSMPMVANEKEAQSNLDVWANKKGLMKYVNQNKRELMI